MIVAKALKPAVKTDIRGRGWRKPEWEKRVKEIYKKRVCQHRYRLDLPSFLQYHFTFEPQI